jgi:predicted nucleic acid-binding protein
VILLDSNVLMYAVGGDHPFKPLAAALVSLADTGRFRVTPRVLEEFGFVYARRGRTRAEAVEFVGEWASSFAPVEYASEEDLAAGFDLWANHSTIDVADGILAAQARRLDAQLVSADRGFAEVEELDWIDLADPDLLERLETRT